jgi:hypothetical protein
MSEFGMANAQTSYGTMGPQQGYGQGAAQPTQMDWYTPTSSAWAGQYSAPSAGGAYNAGPSAQAYPSNSFEDEPPLLEGEFFTRIA